MNSAAATAYTLYAIPPPAAPPALSKAVATEASSSLPTAPDWHAFSTTTGTRPCARTPATFDAVTPSPPPPGRSHARRPGHNPLRAPDRGPARCGPAGHHPVPVKMHPVERLPPIRRPPHRLSQ